MIGHPTHSGPGPLGLTTRRLSFRSGTVAMARPVVAVDTQLLSLSPHVVGVGGAARGVDLPPSDGAKDQVGIADLKEGMHAAKEAFG